MKSSLPKLDLELLPSGWRKRWPGWLMLTLGTVCLIVVIRHDLQLRHGIATAVTAAGIQEVPSADDTLGSSEESRAVQMAIRKLGMPWSTLFAAIEAHAGGSVQLLAVTPDATQGTVLLEAQAPDIYEMLEYVRDLSTESALTSVVLGGYEMTGDSSAPMVRFSVNAQWRSAS